MRKLRRWAFNTLTVLSLLLCIVMAGIWVRSYRHCFGIVWETGQTSNRAWWNHDRFVTVDRGIVLALSKYQEWPDDPNTFSFGTSPQLHRTSYFDHPTSGPRVDVNRWLNSGKAHALRFAGFEVTYPIKAQVEAASRRPHRRFTLVYDMVLPLWSLTLLFALLPSIALVRLFRRRRIPPGHCRHCRYNLHANLSGTCPECGQPTAPAEPRRV